MITIQKQKELVNNFVQQHLQKSINELEKLQKENIELKKTIALNISVQTEKASYLNELKASLRLNKEFLNLEEQIYDICSELYFHASSGYSIEKYLEIYNKFFVEHSKVSCTIISEFEKCIKNLNIDLERIPETNISSDKNIVLEQIEQFKVSIKNQKDIETKYKAFHDLFIIDLYKKFKEHNK